MNSHGRLCVHRILYLALLLAYVPCAAHAVKKRIADEGTKRALDRKYGFREVRFGTSRSLTGDMEACAQGLMGRIYNDARGADWDYLRRPADVLQVGDIPLYRITYGFWKGTLAEIEVLVVNDNENIVKMLGVLREAYGQEDLAESNSHFWIGKNVHLQYVTSQGEILPDIYRSGVAVFTSRKIDAMIEKEKKESSRRAARDL